MVTETDDELIARILKKTATAAESDDELIARILRETEPTLGQSIVGTAKSLVRGAVTTVSEGLHGAGALAQSMRDMGMGGTIVGSPDESMFTAAGRGVEAVAPEVNPYVAQQIPAQIAGGLGQVGALMGIGALNPALAAETAFLGGVSETERQVASEMTDEDGGAGLGTLLAGGAIGAADMIPVGGVLARINRVMGGKLAVAGLRLAELQKLAQSGGALATAGRIAETTALEAGTEALQKVATNALVNHATDQELDLMRGVLPEGGMGGAVGGILASVVELATAKRRGMAVRAAKMAIPLEEYRIRRETDPVFRQNEEAALNDMIAAEYGVKLTEPVDSQVSEDPALFDDTQGNLYNDPVEGMRVLANPGPQENPRVSRPARVSEAEAMASQTVEEPPRYADGTLYEEGMRPNSAEYSRRSPGIPEGSQAPASPGEVHFDKWRASIWDDVKQGRFHPEESVPSNRDILAGKAQPKRLFRGVSDAEMNAARSSGSFVPIRGDGDLYVTPDPDRLSGGAYGAKGGGHIVEFDPVPLHAATGRLIDVDEVAASEIPMSAVRRIWTWDKSAKDHVLSYDRSRPTSPAAASGEQATQPFTPSSSVRAAPSAAARVPVPRQHAPDGSPVLPITGQRSSVPWGGSSQNLIGAKLPTALEDVSRAIVEFAQLLGVQSIGHRTNTGTGVTGSFGAAGTIDFHPSDPMTGAHELGHLVHRWLMENQRSGAQVATNPNASLDLLPPAVQGEIRGLAYQGVAPGRALPEGFAELMQKFLMVPEEARAVAPQASRWLENWIVSQPRNVRESLMLVQRKAQDYRFQGDEMRRRVPAPLTRAQRAEGLLKILPWEAAVRRIWDDTATAGKFDKGWRNLIISLRGAARGWIHNHVEGIPTDFNGNAIEGAKNLETVLRALPRNERALFDEYLLSRRTLALEGKGVSTGKAPAEALRLVEDLNVSHPHFAGITDNLSTWWGNVNRVLAQASPTYQAGLDRIAADDAKYEIDFYAPIHRWLETPAGKAWGSRGRHLMNDVSRTLTGSEAPAKSPLDAFVVEARTRFEQAAMRNIVESLIDVFDSSGGMMGPKTSYMREITAEDAGPKAMNLGTEGSLDSFLAAMAAPEQQGDLMSVKVLDRSGKLRFFLIDRRLAEQAGQVDPATLRNGLGFWMRQASRSRRVLSTTQIVYNFGFQFFTNLALDVPMAYLAPSYFKPHELHELAGYTAMNVLNNVRAAFTPNSPAPKWIAAYERLGLHGSAGLSGETQIGRTVTNLSGGRSTADKMWQGVAAFMSIPQRSVQIALMQKAAKLYKIDITQPITADEANILRLAARQPVDYNAGGDLSRKWQLIVPFLRPALDSERQLAESMKRNPIEFFAKAGVLAALYSTIRYLFADDELEKRKSGVDAMRSITIPAGGGEAIELRVPGEIAWLTLAPIALYQAMSEDGQDPGDLAMGAVRNMLPPGFFSNPALNTLLQQAMNRQNPSSALFSGDEQAPIVPNALQGMDGLAQRTPATAPVAIAFANMAHAVLAGVPEDNPFKQMASSPIRWESGIRSLLGGNGLAAVEGWAIVPGLAPPVEPELADSILQGIFRRNGTASWNDRYIREVFELNRAAMQKKATLNGQFEDPMDAMRRESLARTAAALSQARFLTTYDNASMSVEKRREMARKAQKVASDTIRALKDGKMPTAFYGLEAETRGARSMYDLQRGALFK